MPGAYEEFEPVEDELHEEIMESHMGDSTVYGSGSQDTGPSWMSDWAGQIEKQGEKGEKEEITLHRASPGHNEGDPQLETVVYKSFSQRLRSIQVRLKCVGAFLQLRNRGLPLTALDISGCELNDTCGPMISTFLKEHTALHNWTLDYNNLSDKFVYAIQGPLNGHSITNISMKGCSIGDDGVEALAKIATHSSHLMSINISENRVTNVGAAWIASLAQKFTLDNLRIGKRVNMEPGQRVAEKNKEIKEKKVHRHMSKKTEL